MRILAATFRQQLSKIVPNLTDAEMEFATKNLQEEIDHKFYRLPTPQECLDILLANIKFHRIHKDVIEEIKLREVL